MENSDTGMDPEAEGFRLIGESYLMESTKHGYRVGWECWVRWCGDAGVNPLAAAWEDVLGFLRSVGSANSGRVKTFRAAVGCVYHSRVLASPSDDRRLGVALGRKRHASPESYGEAGRRRLSGYRADYLAWCRLQRRKPAPAGGEQVVAFLSSVAERLSNESLRLANTSVSLYLMEQGYPPTESHPLVVAAIEDLQGKPSDREAAVGELSALYKRAWVAWRDAQNIVAGAATVSHVLRYLGQYEHQATAGIRLARLRYACEGESAFWSEEVGAWLDEFQTRLGRGEVPGNSAAGLVRRFDPVLAEWSAARKARVGAERRVPVGLTKEEVERVRVGQGRRLEPVTVEGYAYHWANFSEWRDLRGIPLEKVEPVHIQIYLEKVAERLTVASLWCILAGIAFGFEEHGFVNNPAMDDEVVDYLGDLEVERKEKPFQMSPIREAEFSAILESAFEPRPREGTARAEIRGALTVALVRFMFDGLLRGSDASRARWGDLSRSGDGTGNGSFLLSSSKTDKYGRGEYTFVSNIAFQYLDLLRDLRRFDGKAEREDDRIFGFGVSQMGRVIGRACAHAGLEGAFGTHSMRIGGAQELANAGYSLPMIMLAGRWASPGTVKRYIEKITVQDGAMAQMQRMVASGKYRLGPDARGIDVMSNYRLVRSAG